MGNFIRPSREICWWEQGLREFPSTARLAALPRLAPAARAMGAYFFLARDTFGAQHRPLPQARRMLYDRVAALANESGTTSESNDAG